MTQLVKCDTRINMFYEKKEKTPDEKLAIAKIQVMMEDAFGILSNSESSPALQDRAKHWFDTADCSMWCDMAGTNQEYIKKLFDNLQYNYNSGKITKEQLKFGISRLELKI